MGGINDLMGNDNLAGQCFASDADELAHYAQEAMNRVAAQYRFAGLVAGIKGPKDTDEDVEEARDKVIQAIAKFLDVSSYDFENSISGRYSALRTRENALRDQSWNRGEDISGWLSGSYSGHPGDLGSYGPELASGAYRERLESIIASRRLSEETAASLREFLTERETLAGMAIESRALARERIRQSIKGMWSRATAYYEDKMALIRENRYLLAAGKITVDGLEMFHFDIVVAVITVAVIAATGGVATTVAPLIAVAVSRAIQVAKASAGLLDRAADGARTLGAATVFRVHINVVEPNAHGSVDIVPGSIYTRDIDVETDLTPDENKLRNEENQGTTEATQDGGESVVQRASIAVRRDERYDNIVSRLDPETLRLAQAPGASPAQISARRSVVDEFLSEYGVSRQDSNILDESGQSKGMSLRHPMVLLRYPPPSRIASWRNEHYEGYGNYFDPSGGTATPDELGINSVGRVQDVIDTQNKPGLALQGIGAPIEDTWSIVNGARMTSGGRPQIFIPNDHKPDFAQRIEPQSGLTWRALPGNEKWVELERQRDLEYTQLPGKSYPSWVLRSDVPLETGENR